MSRSEGGITRPITFDVRIAVGADQPDVSWSGTYDPFVLCCTSETLTASDARLDVRDNHYTVEGEPAAVGGADANGGRPIAFKYQGSILSQFRDDALPPSLARVKQLLAGTESLDTLTPDYLRRASKDADGSLGHGGQNLAAFVDALPSEAQSALVRELREAYPRLKDVRAESLRAGLKRLAISERYGDHGIETDADHVNDGMLRLIAILASLRSGHDVLLFDEIENGINPELVEFVVTALTTAKQQVIATTHSPLILNYLDDDVAREAVVLIYKTATGNSEAVPLFDVPSLAEKLKYMGPGEAFVDTDLTALSDEIARRPARV